MEKDLQKIVFAERPKLKEVYEKEGGVKLVEYAGRAPRALQLSSDFPELLEIIKTETAKIFGEIMANEFVTELSRTGYVSTVDHHGTLSHPSFFHGNLVQAIANHKAGFKYVPIFSTASVSLDNHSFPRGFVLHEKGLEKRLPFFTDREKHLCVYGAPAYRTTHVRFFKNAKFPIPFQKTLSQMVLDPKLFTFANYRDQATYLNHLLWKNIFPETKLIMLPIEKIVARTLSEIHFKKETPLTKLCTDETVLVAFEKYFDGVPSAFDTKNNHGTFLFWGLKNGRRIRLFREGMSLIGEDKTFRIALTKEALSDALASERIMPSLALCLMILSFYYGMTLGGGYSQVDYLPQIREALLKVTPSLGANIVWQNPATSHIGSDILIFFMKTIAHEKDAKNDILVPVTTLDYLLHKDSETFTRVEKLVETLTLGNAIENVLPDLYTILTHQKVSYDPHVEPIFIK